MLITSRLAMLTSVDLLLLTHVFPESLEVQMVLFGLAFTSTVGLDVPVEQPDNTNGAINKIVANMIFFIP